jgi:ComF family protein
VLRNALSLLAPPLCAACGAAASPSEPLCRSCAAAIGRERASELLIPGTNWAVAAAEYAGAARAAVYALKFRARLPLASQMAASIAAAAGTRLTGATIVPVPSAPRRRRRRGFDPAEAIATALARRAERPLARCLDRSDGPRQVGRPRRERISSPPVVAATRRAPERAVLVDDVTTTGATLAACASTLRAAGAVAVGAVTFAHTK